MATLSWSWRTYFLLWLHSNISKCLRYLPGWSPVTGSVFSIHQTTRQCTLSINEWPCLFPNWIWYISIRILDKRKAKSVVPMKPISIVLAAGQYYVFDIDFRFHCACAIHSNRFSGWIPVIFGELSLLTFPLRGILLIYAIVCSWRKCIGLKKSKSFFK